MRTRHLVLGLLAQQPMSGYDIKCFLESLSWLVDSPSYGSLYPALHALLADGLATVEEVPGQGRPPRKIYSITEAGEGTLKAWLSRPMETDSSLRAFVMRLVLAGSLPSGNLNAYLEQRREQVAAHQRKLEQSAGEMTEEADVGERLMLDYGLTLANAELDWLDRTLARLVQLPLESVSAISPHYFFVATDDSDGGGSGHSRRGSRPDQESQPKRGA
jgi:PadR family transcriptional regulator AphA